MAGINAFHIVCDDFEIRDLLAVSIELEANRDRCALVGFAEIPIVPGTVNRGIHLETAPLILPTGDLKRRRFLKGLHLGRSADETFCTSASKNRIRLERVGKRIQANASRHFQSVEASMWAAVITGGLVSERRSGSKKSQKSDKESLHMGGF